MNLDIKSRIVDNLIILKFCSEGCEIISTIKDAVNKAKIAADDRCGNFVFTSSYLISIFIAAVKYNTDAVLINCLASENRINDDLYKADFDNCLRVYYNVGKCSNVRVLSSINKNSILCL